MSRRFRRSATSRRGAAMLSVTLIGVLAAGLAILIVRQVIVTARANVFEELSEQARDLADQTLDEVIADLAADPTLPLRQVLDDEASRNCVVADAADAGLLAANGDHPIYDAGEAWPPECGTFWTHEPSDIEPVAVRVLPPDASGDLAIQVMARSQKVQAGRQAQLSATNGGDFALWTDDNLDLDAIASGQLELEGLVYAGRRILLPTGTVTWGDVLLAAEEGFVGTPDDSEDQRFYAADPDPDADPVIRDIRDVVEVAGSASSLRSALGTSARIACPTAGDPVEVQPAPQLRSSHLCLEPGRNLLDDTGALVAVPDAGAFLVLPEASAPGTADVLWRSEATPTDQCQISCDLYGNAATDAAADDHPGTRASWTDLGTFPLPASGVIGSPIRQTQVGLCGTAFLSGGASPCDVTSSTDGVTIVVGDAGSDVDAIIGGPLSNIGIATSRDLLLAFWAGPRGGDVSLDAHLVTPGRLTGIPAVRPTMPSDATGGTLTLSGAVVVANLSPVQGFTTVEVVPSGIATTPWLPGPDAGLKVHGARDLSPLEACGARSCEPWG